MEYDVDALADTLTRAIQAQNENRLDEAESLFKAALTLHPGHPAACYSLGLIALRGGRGEEAVHWATVGVAAAPGYAPLQLLAGAAIKSSGGDMAAVLERYDAALALQPDYVEALVNSGVVLREMQRPREALERFNRVLAIKPDYPTALANCAVLLTEFHQSEQAIAMFERLLKVDPSYDYGLGLLMLERLHVCDWTDYQANVEAIVAGTRAGRRATKSLAMMAISDEAGDHYLAARTFAQHLYPRARPLWNGETYRHERIRIAYVSPDLREHPVGHLMAGVFEHHDKQRFETIAISLGVDDKSRLRSRMLAAFDQFHDVKMLPSQQIARLMRELEVDVAVDLAGFTADSRPDVFAQRPAPIQVGFLGYAGSSATDYIDYLVADRHVAPREHWPYYTERIVYLPDAYMPVDDSLVISDAPITRADFGLPESGIVFCAFCHDFKITPLLFAIWMRLLARTPGSVLWLMSRNETSQRNLRSAAESQGVAPERLVFATRLPRVEDHLARYRLADLFLDTFPYNAHTTAADALLSGLPVLTCMGNAYHARVAGSLLHAVGLPELATHSLADYEAAGLALATQPSRLADLKARLVLARSTSPMFATQQFCRRLEEAYLSMQRRHQLGNFPDAL